MMTLLTKASGSVGRRFDREMILYRVLFRLVKDISHSVPNYPIDVIRSLH